MSNILLHEKQLTFFQYIDKYYHQVYEMFSLYNGKELVRYKENFFHKLNFYSNFKENLTKRYYNFLLIYNINKSEIIGFIYMYNYEPKNETVFLDIFMKNDEYYGAISLGFLNSYLENVTSNKKIRTIYTHCFEYEKQKQSFFKRCNFKLIGRMCEYRYYNKNYVDVNILELNL